jgi:hypothetical protein
VVKLGARSAATGRVLLDCSLGLLRAHLSRRPGTNPFTRYGTAFASHLDWVAGGPIDNFHRYAFATLRQCGSAFALAAAYFRWLETNGEDDLRSITEACEAISTTAKTLQFKTARVVQTGRPFDAAPLIAGMAESWDAVMQGLAVRYGAPSSAAERPQGSVASTRR